MVTVLGVTMFSGGMDFCSRLISDMMIFAAALPTDANSVQRRLRTTARASRSSYKLVKKDDEDYQANRWAFRESVGILHSSYETLCEEYL
jgi:ERCC4-related helicase